ANALDGAVPEEIREERRARLMQAQAEISAARLRRFVGRRIRVLVDQVGPRQALARSVADAPEIDGVVHLPASKRLKAGEFAEVDVVASDAHDLHARLPARERAGRAPS
ncbi:MAG TPA: 30S ribosomal protein S12 methylthiotransferase RimO, partial [Burkholderiaceae bacterium]|nr:30S ribosomal protein S12 methylthiotransferase RimO [Burkholderiaceae bacterium]